MRKEHKKVEKEIEKGQKPNNVLHKTNTGVRAAGKDQVSATQKRSFAASEKHPEWLSQISSRKMMTPF